jgi:4-carboxymuconolactone decarboxylase
VTDLFKDAGPQFEKGLVIRKAVLGDAYVENSLNAATPFNMEIQKLATEYCWGDIWSRPGIDRKARSMVNLAMLTALNRHHEFKVHVRGAINNGVTADEIKEILLQSAIYVGLPASLEHFRLAAEVLVEMGLISND